MSQPFLYKHHLSQDVCTSTLSLSGRFQRIRTLKRLGVNALIVVGYICRISQAEYVAQSACDFQIVYNTRPSRAYGATEHPNIAWDPGHALSMKSLSHPIAQSRRKVRPANRTIRWLCCVYYSRLTQAKFQLYGREVVSRFANRIEANDPVSSDMHQYLKHVGTQWSHLSFVIPFSKQMICGRTLISSLTTRNGTLATSTRRNLVVVCFCARVCRDRISTRRTRTVYKLPQGVCSLLDTA